MPSLSWEDIVLLVICYFALSALLSVIVGRVIAAQRP